jgi:DNA-binding IclR family transcriptional regulator
MNDPRIGKTKGIAAVDRALRVLDSFVDENPLALAELARRSGLVKPTVLRALVSLAGAGYVVRLSDGRYQLGAKLMRLGLIYQRGFKLDDHVLPVLKRLADTTGESASFFVRQNDQRLCLFRVDSPQSVRDVVRPGSLMPIDETSSGQIFTTFGERGNRTESRFSVFASAGIRDPQTASIATPIFGQEGQLCGALALSGPIQRFGAVETTRMTQQLIEAASHLTTVLSGASQSETVEKQQGPGEVPVPPARSRAR